MESLECSICHTAISHDLYAPEWSDVPTEVIYSCSYGCTHWREPYDEGNDEWWAADEEQSA